MLTFESWRYSHKIYPKGRVHCTNILSKRCLWFAERIVEIRIREFISLLKVRNIHYTYLKSRGNCSLLSFDPRKQTAMFNVQELDASEM